MNNAPENTPSQNPAPQPQPAPSPAPAAPAQSLGATLEKINTATSRFVAKLVVCATRALSPALIGKALGCSRSAGHYAVLLGIVLTLVYAIIAAIRYESFAFFAIGVGLAVGIVIAQYAATRFMASSDNILSNTPNRISSKAFLDCAGLLLLLAAIGIFVGGIWAAIEMRAATPLVSAIVIAPLLTLAAAIALNPEVIGLEIRESSAGEEAIGLISFCLKIWLKIVPALFFLLSVAGCVITIWSFFNSRMGSFNFGASGGKPLLPFIDVFMVSGMAGPSLVLYACMTPVLVYLCFILWSLALDIARAILVLPSKIDGLKK